MRRLVPIMVYREAPPERGIFFTTKFPEVAFFKLQVYERTERVGSARVEVSMKGSVILKGPFSSLKYFEQTYLMTGRYTKGYHQCQWKVYESGIFSAKNGM